MKWYAFLLGVFLFLFPIESSAHNTQLATFHIIQQENSWVMTVSLAQVTVEHNVKKKHPDINLATIPREEYQSLVLNYLLETVQIQANDGQKIELISGKTTTDGHQNSSEFKLENMPSQVSRLDFQVNSFAGQSYHANIIRVYYFPDEERKALQKKKIVLSPKNEFKGQLEFN